MGVPIGEATGDHPALLECAGCGERYETDETMANDCPQGCTWDGYGADIVSTDPAAPWRDHKD